MPRPDQRSDEARVYRRLYNDTRWRHPTRGRRAQQLQAEPLCRMCRAAGRLTPATVADHVKPHRGDERAFFEGELQSLCDVKPWRCHSQAKQQQEVRGFSMDTGADGMPTDPRHPFYAGG